VRQSAAQSCGEAEKKRRADANVRAETDGEAKADEQTGADEEEAAYMPFNSRRTCSTKLRGFLIKRLKPSLEFSRCVAC
jgi:hypothetical protein